MNSQSPHSLSDVIRSFKNVTSFCEWKKKIASIFERETLRLGIGYTFESFDMDVPARIICASRDCTICASSQNSSVTDSAKGVKHQESAPPEDGKEEYSKDDSGNFKTIAKYFPFKTCTFKEDSTLSKEPSHTRSQINKKLISTSIIHPHQVEIQTLPKNLETLFKGLKSTTSLHFVGHKRKESEQHISIIGQLLKYQLLQKNVTFVEVGSGRGDLSLSISQCLKVLGQFTNSDTNITQNKAESVLASNTDYVDTTILDVQNSSCETIIDTNTEQVPNKRKRKQTFNKNKFRRCNYPDDDISDISTQFILLDRQIHRKKKDNQIRLNHPRLHSMNIHENVLVKRYKMDIRDFKPSDIDLQNRSTVCISKHFCGAATDLLLKQVDMWKCNIHPNNQNSSKKFEGFFICLCCHHQCTWDDYINQNYMTDQGLTIFDFACMKWISTWGVTQFRVDRSGWEESQTHEADREAHVVVNSPLNSKNSDRNNQYNVHNTKHTSSAQKESESQLNSKQDWLSSLSIQEKIELGFQCKRLIDYGRIEFLKQNDFACNLVQYVDGSITPECYLLRAVPL